jgi:hypothetical protein
MAKPTPEETQLHHARTLQADARDAEIYKQQQAAGLQEMVAGDEANITEYLLEDTDVPQNIKELLPMFFNKEFALSNFANDDVMYRMWNLLLAAKYDVYIKKPHFEITEDLSRGLNQALPRLYAKMLRSTGGNTRERVLIRTLISAIEKLNSDAPQAKGWFGRKKAKGGGVI